MKQFLLLSLFIFWVFKAFVKFIIDVYPSVLTRRFAANFHGHQLRQVDAVEPYRHATQSVAAHQDDEGDSQCHVRQGTRRLQHPGGIIELLHLHVVTLGYLIYLTGYQICCFIQLSRCSRLQNVIRPT